MRRVLPKIFTSIIANTSSPFNTTITAINQYANVFCLQVNGENVAKLREINFNKPEKHNSLISTCERDFEIKNSPLNL